MTIADTDVLIDFLAGVSPASTIGRADSVIAGIALARGAELLTRNRRQFERVRGLRLAALP